MDFGRESDSHIADADIPGVDRLRVALERLASEDLPARVGPELVELEELRSRLDAQISRRLERFDRGLEHTLESHRSPASWLSEKVRAGRGDAHSRVRVARQLSNCPMIRAAWERGAISTRHVEVLVRTRHAAHANAEFADFEPAAVEVALRHTPEVLTRVCQRWREALDTDRQTDPAHNDSEQRFARRGLHASESLDGMVVLDGVLDPSTGEVVRTALELAMDDERVLHDPRSLPQLRADALGAICEHYLSLREPGTNRPHVVLHVPLETLAGFQVGGCRTEGGTEFDSETARRWACDSIVQRVLTSRSIPLDLGRSVRSFTPAQHRALAVRDGGCRWPGCTQPARRARGHHIEYWTHDGPTDLANGLLLCPYHHRLVHEGRHYLERPDDDDDPFAVAFYTPDGRCLGITRPRHPPDPHTTQAGRDSQRARERLYALAVA